MTRFEELAWDQLSAHALYEALALRQRVFVVEQDCVYLDADGKDRIARHLFAWEGAQLVAEIHPHVFRSLEREHDEPAHRERAYHNRH